MLSKKAMLVQLSVGCWQARKHDRKASAKTEQAHDSKIGTVRVTKALIRKEAINKVASQYRAVKQYFNDHTRPWAKGIGLLKNTAYDEFVKQMAVLKQNAEMAVEDFIPLYPDLYEEARQDLGKMFNPEDYPIPEQIRNKFSIRIKFMPVPEAGDFRVEGLSEVDIAELRKSIEADTKDSLAEVLKETYREFGVYIGRMVERLDDRKKTGKKTKGGSKWFHDSLVDNIKDLVDRLPNLNITDDPELTKIGQEIKEKLTEFDADDLRVDKKLRSKVKADAEAMAKKLAGYF
jgi:hypothetical protein